MLGMPLSHEEAQEIARSGTGKWAYLLIKAVLAPIFRAIFLMRISGLDNIPKTGPVVIAPNHKSFWDGFFIAAVMRRRVFFMGKSELFQGKAGRFLLALGGFPVRRGSSDAEAIETGAPIIPTAITGTEKRRWPLPRRVQIAFGEPIPVSGLTPTPEDAGALIEGAVWPTITEDYHRLKARPGLIAAGVAAVGLGVAVHKLRKR